MIESNLKHRKYRLIILELLHWFHTRFTIVTFKKTPSIYSIKKVVTLKDNHFQ